MYGYQITKMECRPSKLRGKKKTNYQIEKNRYDIDLRNG